MVFPLSSHGNLMSSLPLSYELGNGFFPPSQEPAQGYTVNHQQGQHSKFRSSDFKSNTASCDALAAPWRLLSTLGPGSCPKPQHTVPISWIFRKWTLWAWPFQPLSLVYFFVKSGLRIPLASRYYRSNICFLWVSVSEAAVDARQLEKILLRLWLIKRPMKRG